MLISEQVEAKWHGSNRKHFESRGLIYTSVGNVFTVSINDLSPQSHFKVKLKCDYCNEPFEMQYDRYLKSKKSIFLDKDCCNKCIDIKKEEVRNIRKEKVKYIEINDFFEENNCLLLTKSIEYIGFNQQLEFICNNHCEEGIQNFSWKKARLEKYLCSYCFNKDNVLEQINGNTKINKRKIVNKRKTSLKYEDVEIQFSSRNLILLDEVYINNRSPLKYMCKNHPEEIQETTYASLQGSKYCCKFCSIESRCSKQRLQYETVKVAFEKYGFQLLDTNYKNNVSNLKCICMHHPNEFLYISYSNLISDNHGCKFCSYERKIGANNCNWNGGISNIYEYVRSKITRWKKDSMKSSSYKCVITGNKFDVIHHLYSFHKILGEALFELGLDIHENISKYADGQLTSLVDKVMEIHYNYPLGVCLSDEVHKKFHFTYGQKNNTAEQFEEFKKNYYLNTDSVVAI